MLTYQLERDPDWASQERKRYFGLESDVHDTRQRFANELQERGIDDAVAGGLCTPLHEIQRFADASEVLVTPEGLDRVRRELVGQRYDRLLEIDRSIRDAENGVRISFS